MHLSEKKYFRANEAPFMTKEVHNSIMKRSRYRNKFLKDKSQTSRENYKIQRNFCKKLLRKTKKSYFESLNTKKSRIIEPSGKLLFLFPQKRRQKVKRLSLMKQKKHFTHDKKIYTIFNSFFSDFFSYLIIVIIFHKTTYILSQLSSKSLKNTPVFSILEKGYLIQYFHSERLLKRGYRKLSGI